MFSKELLLPFISLAIPSPIVIDPAFFLLVHSQMLRWQFSHILAHFLFGVQCSLHGAPTAPSVVLRIAEFQVIPQPRPITAGTPVTGT